MKSRKVAWQDPRLGLESGSVLCFKSQMTSSASAPW